MNKEKILYVTAVFLTLLIAGLIILLPSNWITVIVKTILLGLLIRTVIKIDIGHIKKIFRSSRSAAPPATGTGSEPHTASKEENIIEDDFINYLKQFIKTFKTVFDAGTCALYLYHKGLNVFKLKYHLTDYPDLFSPQEIEDEKGLFHIVLTQNSPVIENDIELEPRFLPYYSSGLQINGSAAVFPLKYRNELVGVVVMDSEKKSLFDENQKQLAGQLLSQFEIQLRSSNLLYDLQTEAEQNKAFMEIAHTFNITQYFEQIWESAQPLAEKYLTWERAVVILSNHPNPNDKDYAYIHAIWGINGGLKDGFEFPLNSGIVSWCILNRKPFHIQDLFKRKNTAYRFTPDEGNNLQSRSMLINPIITGDTVYGALLLESQTPYLYTEQDRTLVTFLTDQIGYTLSRIMQQEKLTSLIQKDPDLDIWNQQSFTDRLDEETLRAVRFNSTFSTVMFKITLPPEQLAQNMNSNFNVIGEIVQKIKHKARKIDWFARVDQFHIAVILFETDTAGAKKFTEKIIGSVVPSENIPGQSYSLNAAICNYPQHAKDAATMIRILKNGIISSLDQGPNTVFTFSATASENENKSS